MKAKKKTMRTRKMSKGKKMMRRGKEGLEDNRD